MEAIIFALVAGCFQKNLVRHVLPQKIWALMLLGGLVNGLPHSSQATSTRTPWKRNLLRHAHEQNLLLRVVPSTKKRLLHQTHGCQRHRWHIFPLGALG